MPLLLRILNRLAPRLATSLRVCGILLKKKGFYRSLREGTPVDRHGAPLPWLTYPALDHLSRLDFSKARVLEYGSGQSTLWWSARAAAVLAVEGREVWAERLRVLVPVNTTVLGPLDGDEYVLSPLASGQLFEVIVIDGWYRRECATAALPFLAPGGLLILDNSDWHVDIAAWLREQGLMQFDFHGFGPLNPYTWCTSLFIRGTIALPWKEQPWTDAEHGALERHE